jgi:hypothetical protein
MTILRSHEAVQFLSKAAEKLYEGKADAQVKRMGEELIREMTSLASKPVTIDDIEMIRLKYATHKLDAIIESKFFRDVTISRKTEELLNAEIEHFHEVIRLGKKYFDITIELPNVISEEAVTQLKSAFAAIKNRPRLVIRNSVPLSLIDSLTVFKSILIEFTDNEAIEKTLIHLNRSNSILDLPLLKLDFQKGSSQQRSKKIPILMAEFFGKLEIDVRFLFFSDFLN